MKTEIKKISNQTREILIDGKLVLCISESFNGTIEIHPNTNTRVIIEEKHANNSRTMLAPNTIFKVFDPIR